MEVQQHGNYFEDLKIKELTGYGKEEYDSFKSNGYTSSMDLVEGLHVDRNYSIKTAKGNKVDCGDILRRMVEDDYKIVIGLWKQSGDNKIFHTEYTFNIKPEDISKASACFSTSLWLSVRSTTWTALDIGDNV